MRQLVERSRKDDEERWRHDESIPIPRYVVMDAVKEEVRCYTDSIIR